MLGRNSIARSLSSQSNGETRISQILREKFPQASSVKVVDISGEFENRIKLSNFHVTCTAVMQLCICVVSGGCGAMYEIHIESDDFKGKRTVQQHQLVNQVG